MGVSLGVALGVPLGGRAGGAVIVALAGDLGGRKGLARADILHLGTDADGQRALVLAIVGRCAGDEGAAVDGPLPDQAVRRHGGDAANPVQFLRRSAAARPERCRKHNGEGDYGQSHGAGSCLIHCGDLLVFNGLFKSSVSFDVE